MGKVLILISGSRDKSEKGEGEFEKQSILETIPQFRNELIETRKKIKWLIQSGKVTDRELGGGNRAHRLCNKNLIEGPDFGNEENRKPVYLPAYKRYIGRFFVLLQEEDWLNAKRNGYHILIVDGGLYGFVSFEDSIQNYECRSTDIIISDEDINEYGRIRDYWEDVLTNVLKEYIEKNKIELVLDLLSEASYQYTIRWEEIYKLPVKVLHRVFQKKAGPDILPNLGLFVKNDIFPLPSERILNSDIIKPGQPIKRDYFEDGDILYFEEKIGELEDVAREPLTRPEIEKEMEKVFGKEYWRMLPENERYSIKEGEFLYWRYKNEDSEIPFSVVSPSIIAPWGRTTENMIKKFWEKLFKILQKEGVKEIYIPRMIKVDEFLNKKNKKNITVFETELILRYCNDRDYEKNYCKEITKTIKNIKEIIKNHSLFSLFEEKSPVVRQRILRNDIIHNSDKEGKLIEEFRKLFLNRDTSIIMAYLKLIKELSEQY